MDQQTDLDQADEEILTYTAVSDEELEAASGTERGGANTYTPGSGFFYCCCDESLSP
jgi:hypothetical protein